MHGQKIAGTKFGVPTANLYFPEPITLSFGTYAGYAKWGKKTLEAVIYYGAHEPKKIEVHCLNFHGDLYGTRLTIDPQAKISDNVPWTTEQAMKEKVLNDVEKVKQWFRQNAMNI